MAGSFIILALTGLPQKYASAGISESLIQFLGGIETIRIVHRTAAVVLALVGIWHVGYALWHWFVQRRSLTMLPTRDDLTNAWQTLRYNLGRTEERPQQGFYTFEEKVEYWALIWGTLVMVLTGFFLWNPITATRLLPGAWIPAAKAAHGGEALLAVLAIIIWHLYQVLVRTFNRSMFTGYLTREQMVHEHSLAMHDPPPLKLDPDKLARRKRTFWMGYGLVAAAWLVGLVWFVTVEQTAASTVPPVQEIEAFTPLTPTPFSIRPVDPEAAARYGDTWNGGIGDMLGERCGSCHYPGGEGNLDLRSYGGALAGGNRGPAVVPGLPGISPVYLWLDMENHPGVLSPLEKDALWGWIELGAVEN